MRITLTGTLEVVLDAPCRVCERGRNTVWIGDVELQDIVVNQLEDWAAPFRGRKAVLDAVRNYGTARLTIELVEGTPVY